MFESLSNEECALRKQEENGYGLTSKYERLNIFCFICGLLGHTKKQCPKLYECSAGEIVKAYGHWMKAPNRRNQMNSGERWLRSTSPEELCMKSGNNVELAVAMAVDFGDCYKFGIYFEKER